MNDTELDEALDQWVLQAPGIAVRERARVAFAAERAQRENRSGFRRFANFFQGSGKGLAAGLVAGGMLLLILVQAFPETLKSSQPPFRIPWLVEYEVVRYGNNGLPMSKEAIIAFSRDGREVILNDSDSSIINGIRVGLLRWAPTLLAPPGSSEDATRLKALIGGGCSTGQVIGHEEILKHLTTVVQNISPDHTRTTQWLAPDLECFALRLTSEERGPDGTFRLVLRKQASNIMVNR